MAFLSNIQHLLNGVDIDNLMREINSLKKEISSAKKEISRYSTSLTEKYNEVASLKQQNVSLSEDVTRERNKYSILEGKVDDLRKTITELKKEKEILGTSEQKFKDECERTTKSNASLNGKNLALTNKVKALEEKITQLESIQLRQQSELSEKDAKISMLGADYDKLQSDYNNNKEQLEEANRTIEDEKTAKKVLEEDLAQLRERNRILSEKSDSLQVAVDELASENSRLKEDSAKAKEKIDLLTEESSSKESEKTALREELDKQKTENDSLQQQIQELVAEKEELSPYMYLVEAKKEQEAIESAIKEARENLQKSLDSAMSILSAITHEEVKNSLEDAIKSSRELANSDDSTLEELNNSKESLDSALKVAEEQEKDLIEQEAIESAIKEARENLQKSLDSAMSILSTITHEEVKNSLEDAIKSSRELANSDDNTLEELNNSKESLDSASKAAEEQEKKLIEQEETEQKRREEEEAERKRKEQEEAERLLKEEEEAEQKGNEEEERLKATSVNADEAVDEAFDDDTLPNIYDIGLIPAEKLSIPEVYDVKEERIVNARDFFSQHESELILWRRNLQEEYLMGHARFICPECKQPVKISGHKLQRGRVCYFAHFKDSDDCPYKTGTNRTKEEIERLKYSLVQESERHKRLKAAIASALEGEKSKSMGVGNVECEKRINSEIPYLKWRRPDVYAEYNGRKYVFELQLSTTFVSVIVDRDIFYRLNDYNIIWVFNFEDNKEYVSLHNLMCKDIYYANKRNVFIFDADAEELSKERGELVLKCRWLDENGVWSTDEFVTLDKFQYDVESHKPFIVDADKAYLEKHPEYVERRKQLENSREDLLKALMERQKHEEELEKRRDAERTNLQLELLNTDKCVERFRSGTKYGYHFEGTTILPAKYTSAEAVGENGYAQVGFNRKIGLVRKDGKEIVPVEYRNIDVINSRHGIIMAQYKRIDLWLGDEHFTLASEFDDKEQTIIKESENGKTNYILQTSTYRYSYTQSYYGDHPIRHKHFDGHSKSTLFSIVEEKDYCMIWVDGATYLLSRNHISSVKGSYSDIVSIGVEQLFIAKDNNTKLWGVIDLHGNVVTEFKYAKLIPTESEYLIAKYSNDSLNYGVVDYQGREFIEPQYESLIYLNSERFAFRKDNLWGICDRMGNAIHDAEYTYIRGIESGGLRASTLDSYLTKWTVQDNIPSYHDDNVKLCLLNDKGEISFTEQKIGQYHIRHSGDLYSILSSDNKELVNYSLSYVAFLSESTAIIKNTEGDSGFFIDEKCILIAGCKHIELLSEDLFKFENNDGIFALGDYSGPISDFDYCDIKAIDTCHFIASPKHRWGNYPSGEHVIIDKSGKPISSYFSSIGDFIDGYANAIYQGRKGVIDVAGNMQEKTVMNYEDYTLCEKFETYYFRNKDAEVVSEMFQKVDHLIGMFFIVMRQGEVNVRLFSLEMNKISNNSYSNITHLVGNLFVAQTPKPAYSYSGSNNVYHLYKGIEKLYSYFSSVTLLDNGYIALEQSSAARYNNVQKKWILAKPDGTILNDREYDSIPIVNENSFRVYIAGNEGSIDLDGNPIVEKIACENDYVITHCFADYGLDDPEGNVILSLEEHISSIVITEDSVLIVCRNDKYALYSINGDQITEHKFSTITYETNNCYAVVEGKVKGHIDSLGNYIESSAESITDDGITIFVIMEKYGLRYTNGEIILPAEYSSIKYLKEKLLAVSRNSRVALFDIEGNPLTEFKYSDICCREDGSIQATRNNAIGGLDDKGKEIADILRFNGGYLQFSFGENSVVNDAEEIIVPVGYSKIELLDNDGIFALWKGTKAAISNISKGKTEEIYESVKAIGNGFIVVSRNISKKVRKRHTGYGYRGNPYTYYSTNVVNEKKFGIIDYQLRTIIPCKYASISDFDDEQNLTATNSNGEKKTISLQNLKKKVSHISELSIGTEYEVKVQTFMAIGLVVKIQGGSYIIHRKHLFKDKKNFKKGESFIAEFMGNDQNGHPIWKTKATPQIIEEA